MTWQLEKKRLRPMYMDVRACACLCGKSVVVVLGIYVCLGNSTPMAIDAHNLGWE
eukprot:NODE_952_length_1210_cov_57.097330_g719_i0.p7 GENE.NODE_952_length_1210_cov_57.097330_g719_i0~~NODE_952_length_1210_cov_57.097330_g719_i0.p7  ORF type:complete len:55 (+),score=12.22 NODE_952_length_1210_cov_57.097330_g719_i0:801-965(+)